MIRIFYYIFPEHLVENFQLVDQAYAYEINSWIFTQEKCKHDD